MRMHTRRLGSAVVAAVLLYGGCATKVADYDDESMGQSGTGGESDTGGGGTGGAGYFPEGEGFIWSGYDLEAVVIDEAASGTPVTVDYPGNDYGRTFPATGPMSGLVEYCDHGYGPNSFCMDFLVCGLYCDVDEDCPPVATGTAQPRCGDPFGGDRCALPCGEDAKCPDGMACARSGDVSDFFCYWPGPTLGPGCPGYCAELGVGCDSQSSGECCEGLVCAPWDECEQGTCLQPSWPCSAETAPCCDGTSCVDGYCT